MGSIFKTSKRGILVTLLVLVIVVIVVFSYFIAKPKENRTRDILNTYFSKNYDSNSCSTLFEDLTHDGIEELIVIQILNENMMPENIRNQQIIANNFHGADLVVLQAEKNGGVNEILDKYVSWQHSNWAKIYLYEKDNKEFLFEYDPYTMGGSSHYSYNLYYLSDDGNPIVTDANQIDFHNNDDSKAISQQISDFNRIVQSYIDKAQPLIVYYEDEHGNVDFHYQNNTDS